MADIVVTVPVADPAKDRFFGRFLDRFIEDCAMDLSTPEDDAPFVMIRSDPSMADPTLSGAVKVLIFQGAQAADAFSRGWLQARRTWTRLAPGPSEADRP